MLSRRKLILGAPLLLAPKLQVGCQTNAWPITPGDFAQFLTVLERVRKLGFSGFETSFRNVQDRFDGAGAARAQIGKAGGGFLGVHIFLPEYDPETAIAPWDLLSRVADGGSALGAQRMIVSGRAVSGAAAIGRKAGALNRAGAYCRKRGLGFAYHNHNFEFAGGGAEIEALLDQTDPALVHLALDAGHAYVGGVSVAVFFARHHRRIQVIHLRDFRAGKQVPLGQGEFDLGPLAGAIRKSEWAGWLVNEEERPNDVRPGDAVVEPARNHVRKIFGV